MPGLLEELLVVVAWIGFVAYGVWFFSAKRREREQKEFQERKRIEQERVSRRVSAPERVMKSILKPPKRAETLRARGGSGSSFVNGLAIGFGLAFLATFVILWISIFYASQLSAGISYEKMISAFIYPMLFILATGTVFLTAGIVREYTHVREQELELKGYY